MFTGHNQCICNIFTYALMTQNDISRHSLVIHSDNNDTNANTTINNKNNNNDKSEF